MARPALGARGVVLSTAYLAWSAAAQWHVRGLAQASVVGEVPPRAMLVTPAPLNTLLWRIADCSA